MEVADGVRSLFLTMNTDQIRALDQELADSDDETQTSALCGRETTYERLKQERKFKRLLQQTERHALTDRTNTAKRICLFPAEEAKAVSSSLVSGKENQNPIE
jgi:hypothetical protein